MFEMFRQKHGGEVNVLRTGWMAAVRVRGVGKRIKLNERVQIDVCIFSVR